MDITELSSVECVDYSDGLVVHFSSLCETSNNLEGIMGMLEAERWCSQEQMMERTLRTKPCLLIKRLVVFKTSPASFKQMLIHISSSLFRGKISAAVIFHLNIRRECHECSWKFLNRNEVVQRFRDKFYPMIGVLTERRFREIDAAEFEVWTG